MMIVVVLWTMIVFIMGCVQVLVGRVVLIVNVAMYDQHWIWIPGRLVNRKAYSNLMCNEKWKQPAHDKGTLENADTLLYKALNQGAFVNSELLD